MNKRNDELETKRLYLKLPSLDYLNDFYEYAKNPIIGEMAGWHPHKTKLETMFVINNMLQTNDYIWFIVLKKSNKMIGTISVVRKMFNKYEVELGYSINFSYWNNGYGYEASKEVIDFCFKELKVKKIKLLFYKDNIRSINLAKKLGCINFCEEKVKKNKKVVLSTFLLKKDYYGE